MICMALSEGGEFEFKSEQLDIREWRLFTHMNNEKLDIFPSNTDIN